MLKFKFIMSCLTLIPTLWLVGYVGFSVVSLSASPQKVNQTTDAIVVLTGGKNRVDEGLALFAAGKASHLFISGVHPDVTSREIKSRWNGATALPPCCLTLGKKATTTIENATETAEWVKENDIQSIRLVTSNYHMARARLELGAVMPDIEILKNPIEQDDLKTHEKRIWKLLFSEYHKFMLRRVQLLFA